MLLIIMIKVIVLNNDNKFELKPLPSVGHHEMDQEHHAIDTCLLQLTTTPSLSLLEQLKSILL